MWLCPTPWHGDRSGSRDPWIDDVYAAMLEIGGVPGCHGRTMRPGNRCDHGIQLRYRAACPAPCGHNCGKGARGILIERQDPARKLLGKHLLDGRQQSQAALTRRQCLHAVQNFRLGNGRREHGQWLLGGEPTEDDGGRQWLESFRKHVRVEYYHLASFGGRRTASRGGKASSTPPRGSKCRRMDSARLSRGRRFALSPAFRISRASCSMDLPWPAARKRRFALTASSRRRMVMLAIHQ